MPRKPRRHRDRMSETQTNSTTSATPDPAPSRFPDVRRLVAQHPAEVLVAVVAVLAFADYVSRCARVITRDDPAELQVVALAGGIPHGTSYPLYVWLTRAFAHVPVGTLSFRFNLFSSVCAAITLVALAATVAHIDQKERRGWIAGAFAAVVFAPSYSFTQVASFTGMYTLHTAMTFVGVGLFVRWMEQKRPADLERSLVVLAAMLANHVMTVAIYPAIFVALVGTLIADRARFSVHRGPLLRGVLGGIAAVLVFDLFFFYLLWKNHVTFDHWASIVRAPKFFDVRPDQAKSFAYAFYYEITCRQFRFDVVGATWDQRMQQLGFVLPRLASELSPLVVALAFVGLGRLARRAPLRFALVATFVFAHLWLASGYTATVKTHIYLLPVTALTAGLAGYGGLAVADVLRKLFAAHPPRALFAFGTLATFVLLHEANRTYWERELRDHPPREGYGPLALRNLGPRPDEHLEHATLDEARKSVAVLPPKALVFADWSIIFAMQWVGRYERGGYDLEIHDPYPYGSGKREFPIDHLERIVDPNRTVRVFFQGGSRPPEIPGYRVVTVSNEIVEVVKDAPQATKLPETSGDPGSL